MDMDAPAPSPTAGLVEASVLGRCPRCGERTLFASVLRFADRCRACGLDYGQFNVGDGPAAFLILIVGAVITTFAVLLELKVHPPFWVHILLWLPITALMVVILLRWSKAALLILEYRNRAREGRLAKPERKAE